MTYFFFWFNVIAHCFWIKKTIAIVYKVFVDYRDQLLLFQLGNFRFLFQYSFFIRNKIIWLFASFIIFFVNYVLKSFHPDGSDFGRKAEIADIDEDIIASFTTNDHQQ